MSAAAAACVRYALRLPAAAQHLVDVEATFVAAAAAPGPVCVTLPVWTPGSYMVREYARNLEGVRATDGAGEPLACRKVRKDAWSIDALAAGDVVVHYRVYGRELTVRTNFVTDEVALLQGAATFLRLDSHAAAPHEVHVTLPAHWPVALCPLPGEQEGRQAAYVAEDYDTLLDSPLLLGAPRCRSFDVGGVHHTLASVGGEGLFDDAAAAAEVAQVVAEVQALFGHVPYANYLFFNLLLGGQGGLEHKNCAVTMAAPTARARPASRADYLGLMAHELFHAWNVKRLRPVALGPFAYDQENYTPSLWAAEGLTAYYDDLVVRRTGLVDDATYFARLARTLESLRATPGQHAHSLTEASFDAWIKLYRPDENSVNTTVSYYLKGSIAGFVLDARLRALSGNARSLDDVMRLAYARFAGAKGYDEAALRGCISEVAGRDESAWLAALLDGRGPIDVSAALDTYGMQLSWRSAAADGGDGEGDRDGAGDRAGALWGVTCADEHGRCTVTRVRRDAPAYDAGLNVGDELLAVGDWRLPAGQPWAEAVRALAGKADVAELLVARLGRLRRLPVPLTVAPKSRATLTVHPDATPAQHAARRAWLAGLARAG